MYLGIRSIRSAGRNSGSIEITLPTQLQVLEGTDCRLIVRDGGQPEIVLQPDLSAPHRFIKDLWQKVRLGLSEIGDAGEFSAADFTLVLFPPDHWQERPPLVYADALKVLRYGHKGTETQNESLTTLIAALAIAAVRRLGLEGASALAFGDALTYLVTGCAAGLGADFERGMAYQALERAPGVKLALGSPLSDQAWLALRPVARQVYEQFVLWQLDAAAYAVARENWYRVFTAEVALSMSPVLDNPEQASRLKMIDGTMRR